MPRTKAGMPLRAGRASRGSWGGAGQSRAEPLQGGTLAGRVAFPASRRHGPAAGLCVSWTHFVPELRLRLLNHSDKLLACEARVVAAAGRQHRAGRWVATRLGGHQRLGTTNSAAAGPCTHRTSWRPGEQHGELPGVPMRTGFPEGGCHAGMAIFGASVAARLLLRSCRRQVTGT